MLGAVIIMLSLIPLGVMYLRSQIQYGRYFSYCKKNGTGFESKFYSNKSNIADRFPVPIDIKYKDQKLNEIVQIYNRRIYYLWRYFFALIFIGTPLGVIISNW